MRILLEQYEASIYGTPIYGTNSIYATNSLKLSYSPFTRLNFRDKQFSKFETTPDLVRDYPNNHVIIYLTALWRACFQAAASYVRRLY